MNEGYAEETNVSSTRVDTGISIIPYASLRAEAIREPRPYSLPSTMSYVSSSWNPLEVGRQDMDPIPLQSQPNAFVPPSVYSSRSRDGMIVGPNHPIFGTSGVNHNHSNYDEGPWGGDGFLPSLGAPHGARFDPVGPSQGDIRSIQYKGSGNRGLNNDDLVPPKFSI